MLLFLISNYSHLEMADCMRVACQREGHKVLYYIEPTTSIEALLNNERIELADHYTMEHEYLFYHYSSIKAVFAFQALLHPAHNTQYIICEFFNKINIPTVEVQHGLFCYSFNFSDSDDHKKISYETSLPLKINSVCTYKLSWFGKNGIGYPKIAKTSVLENFILITSNAQWHIYDDVDRIAFFNILKKVIESNQSELFIFKPHPVELIFNTLFYELIKRANFENLRIIVDHLPSEFYIARCKKGISMISTTLADFQLYNKPCWLLNVKNNQPEFKKLNPHNVLTIENCITQFKEIPPVNLVKELKWFDKKVFLSFLSSILTHNNNKTVRPDILTIKSFISEIGHNTISYTIKKNVLEQLSTNNQQTGRLQDNYNHITTMFDSLQLQNSHITTMFDALQHQNSHMNEMVNDSWNKYNHITTMFDALQHQNSHMNEMVNDSWNKYNHIATMFDALQHQNGHMNEVVNDSWNKYNHIATMFDALQHQNSHMNEMVNDSWNKYNHITTMFDALQHQNGHMNLMLDKSQNECNKVASLLNELIDKQDNRLINKMTHKLRKVLRLSKNMTRE